MIQKKSLTAKSSFTELRIIGISLGVLSLGLALAWLGFFMLSDQEEGKSEMREKFASPSGMIR